MERLTFEELLVSRVVVQNACIVRTMNPERLPMLLTSSEKYYGFVEAAASIPRVLKIYCKISLIKENSVSYELSVLLLHDYA